MTAVAVVAPPAIPSCSPPAPASLQDGARRRRWTRDEYYRAAELGLLRPEERLELLDGEIVEKMTENAPHSSGIRRTRTQAEVAFAGVPCFLSEQHPVTLPDDSEPEPDLAVVVGRIENFDNRHPGPADLLLVLEVANTTLGYDRGPKAAAYAAAGIREYWILNLIDRRLEVHRDPSNGAYQVITLLGETQSVSPLVAPQATLRVADLLPAP